MLSSQVKRSPLLWLQNKSRLIKVKWFGISLVFDIGVFNIARSLCPFLFEENTT